IADRARAAAVQAVPGGTAGEVETETGEGAAAYGVLVTRPDGTRVEVHLDRDFRVLDTEPADGDGG
ncbi:PepSY domain-containing protein, partial [Mycobacterium tuberculosis]|uniref:PepSY domain-containing protein n=1 Tax=Mycobacterium tuberculosis TaxID=1773 RepID=UPI000AD03156